MPTTCSRRPFISAICSLSTLLALASIGDARADPNPYYIGTSVGVTHDSNVLRQPDAQSDTYYSVGLLAGIDQPFGRQRFSASGVVRNNWFQDLKRLDNTSYGLNAALDWATIKHLSGTVSFAGKQNLFNSTGTSTILTNSRNVERSDQSLARVRYGFAALLSLDGSYTHRSLKYSDSFYEARQGLTQDIVSAGITYRPSAGLTIGTAVRQTWAESASGFKSDRHDLDVTAIWVPTGLSTVNARISLGRQNGRGGGGFQNDFQGGSGSVGWLYQPTGKLRFNAMVSHDTGAESGFINFDGQQIGGVGDSSRTTTTASLDANYDATAKIRINANLRASHRSLSQESLDGSDTLHRASIGLTYVPLRNLSMNCNLGRDQRSASGAPISYGYGATTASCSAQITLQ